MNIQEISARLAGLAVFCAVLGDPLLAGHTDLTGALAPGPGRAAAGASSASPPGRGPTSAPPTAVR